MIYTVWSHFHINLRQSGFGIYPDLHKCLCCDGKRDGSWLRESSFQARRTSFPRQLVPEDHVMWETTIRYHITHAIQLLPRTRARCQAVMEDGVLLSCHLSLQLHAVRISGVSSQLKERVAVQSGPILLTRRMTCACFLPCADHAQANLFQRL